MKYGERDGHGRHGQLTPADDGQRLICHECGQAKRALGTHAGYAHGMTAAQYRAHHGLSTGCSLASPATAARFSQHAQNPGSRAALAEHRDVHSARAHNTPQGQRSPQRHAIRVATAQTARRGRRLTDAECAHLRATPSIAAWARLARAAVADGVRQAEIARALGMPRVTVDQRLRRYATNTDVPPGRDR